MAHSFHHREEQYSLVEAFRGGLPGIILRAQWERLLGLINEVTVVAAQEMQTLREKFVMRPTFFSFRGEERAFFMGMLIRHLALTGNSRVPTSWVSLLPHCSHLGGELAVVWLLTYQSSRPSITPCILQQAIRAGPSDSVLHQKDNACHHSTKWARKNRQD